MKKLSDLFVSSALKYADRPALMVKGQYYTYEDLLNRAQLFARRLLNHENDFFILHAERELESYVAILGALLAEKVYVPLSPKNPSKRNQEIMDFIGNQTMDKSYAYMLFTSGTTGQPKAVMTKHESIINYIHIMSDRYRPTCRDRFTQFTDLSFDVAIHEMFLCWANGACLYVINDNQFTQLHKLIPEYQITHWTSVPSMISLIKQFNRALPNAFSSIKYTMLMGEALSYSLVDYWAKLAPNSLIDNLYGPTEATIIFTAYRYDPKYTHSSGYVPIGLPIDGQPMVILNDELSIVERGQTGTLYLGGNQVADGYWHNPEMTKEKFIKLPHIDSTMTWYNTGDQVCWDFHVGLIYKGRDQDFLKVRGGRLERLEVEMILRNAAKSDMAAIIPSDIMDGVARSIIAFIGKSKVTDHEIISYCRDCLPDYMIPTLIIRIDQLPMNKNGKIDYQFLQSYKAGFHDYQHYAYWYPTYEFENRFLYLDEYESQVAHKASVLTSHKPWIVISHGSGGHRFNQYYIAEALAREGFHILAIQHEFDDHLHNSHANDINNLINRPRHISALLDQLNIKNEVIVIGHSFGGYTAMVLGGAIPTKTDFVELSDSRVKKIVLLAPALVELFDVNSCENIIKDILLISADDDEVLLNADKHYRHLFPFTPHYTELKSAGHYTFLMPFPEEAKIRIPEIASDVGMAREKLHPTIINTIIEFIGK